MTRVCHQCRLQRKGHTNSRQREGSFEGYDNRSDEGTDEGIDKMVVVRDQEGFESHDIPTKIFTKWSIEDEVA